MSVNMASESIHQRNSTSGCARSRARMRGSLAQKPAISASSSAML
uniref:Uncharacterized protein n=1 Tax=Arundo donax TaxID=35708 RepID=A0A0A9F8X3_ARUDO